MADDFLTPSINTIRKLKWSSYLEEEDWLKKNHFHSEIILFLASHPPLHWCIIHITDMWFHWETINNITYYKYMWFVFFCYIFSWQTGTVAMVLLSLNALGYIEITFLPVTRYIWEVVVNFDHNWCYLCYHIYIFTHPLSILV